MNSEELKQIFQQKFDYHIFSRKIVHDLFGNNDVAKEPELLDTSAEGDQSYYIGRMTDADERELGFFYTHMAPGCDVRRKRVGLRKLISPYLKYDVDAAIAVFDDGQFWRLSYICDLQGSTTSAKRYSYVMGDVHGQYKTPVERLTKLQQGDISLPSIFEAFSVDALSDDFFKEYHQHYDMIVGSLAGHSSSATMHDYVKKMMGRIVFLHFLQKKGWLCGDPNFMQNTFLQSKRKDDYLESVLEPLFFGMLNTPPEDREQAFRDNGWDIKLLHQWQPANHNSTSPISHYQSKGIPYLNGGLFERDEIDQLTIKLPSWVFESLFNFLASYNFTVDENDPDDAEIGVDPEMLGKIFESLLEDNKAKGAFYTPKEIVWYMCREALIAYLDSKITDLDDSLNVSERHHPNNPAQENRRFSQCGVQDNGDDSVSETRHIHTDIRSFVEHHEFPDTLEPYRKDLDRALREVKICDPAIGSGAFPMGLLNELWRCREALSIRNGEGEMGNGKKDGSISRLQLKREIIENNVYGVDIEKGAIDIARLRFWLSIVVDSEEPEPLPNFDYKFMQGNSLIESFEGVDLSKIFNTPKEGDQFALVFDGENEALELLKSSIQKYFRNSNHKQKAAMRATINEAVKTFIHCKSMDNQELHRRLEEIDCSANQEFFLWHIWFKDIFDKGGFDIVIGNPPYVVLAGDDYWNLQYKKIYATANDGKTNLYKLFFEHGLRILRLNGILSYITPNTYLTGKDCKVLRNLFFTNVSLHEIIEYTEKDKVFENVTQAVTTMVLSKRVDKSNNVKIRTYKQGTARCKQSDLQKLDVIIPLDAVIQKMNHQIGRLSDFFKINQGEVNLSTKKDYYSEYKSSDALPMWRGNNIGKFVPQSWPFEYCEKSVSNPDYYTKERIVMQEVSNQNQPFRTKAIISPKNYICGHSTNSLTPLNSNVPIKFYLGLINSRAFNYYCDYFSYTNHITVSSIKHTPIPQATPSQIQEMVKLVEQIIVKKLTNSSGDTAALEREIDSLVYGLYGLTEEEIAIIEKGV